MDTKSLQKIVYLGGILVVAIAILYMGFKILSENYESGQQYKERAALSEAALDEVQHRGRR